MPTSQKFWALYRKELHELRPEILIVAGLGLLVLILLATVGSPARNVLVFPWGMMIGLAGLLPIVSSFRLGREWNTNSIYLLMSLPVKGGTVLGAKLAALITQYLLGILVIGVTGLIMAVVMIPDLSSAWQALSRITIDPSLWSQIIWGLVLAFVFSLVLLAYVVNISFFSQVVGRLVKRYSGLLTAGIFLFTLWLAGKVILGIWEGLSQAQFIDVTTAPLQLMGTNTLIFAVVAAAVFILTVLIYDRRTEL